MFLKELCELNGVSGDEHAVRSFLKEKITPYADDLTVDTMGNLIALKKGQSPEKKLMISAHMDEVGQIISGIPDKGFLRFKTVGGIDTRVLISKKVVIGEKKIPGVIGMKAIHLQKRSERETVPEIRSLFIDIGTSSEEEAKKLVAIGEYASFDTQYAEIGSGKIKAKALDDRAGCAVLLELIQKPVKYDTYFCFLVQEEVGLRGAQIAAYRLQADAALVLEATTCSDVAGCEEHQFVTQLGGGVALSARDRASIADLKLRKFLEDTAQKNHILYQYKKTTAGGNDAGAIHISGRGIPTASLSVPCRYLHSPAGLIAASDLSAMEQLAERFMQNF